MHLETPEIKALWPIPIEWL